MTKGPGRRKDKDIVSKLGDGAGPYTNDKLVRMDQRFVERMQRAIAAGKEHLPQDSRPERHLGRKILD